MTNESFVIKYGVDFGKVMIYFVDLSPTVHF